MRSEIGDTSGLGFVEDAWGSLPLHAWEALPLPIRVQHRLAEILMLVDELRAEFHDDTKETLRWVDAQVEEISESVESLLECLAS